MQRVSFMLRLGAKFKARGWISLLRLTLLWLERSYGVYIGAKANIGSNVVFPHPTGIVIGDGATISDNCVIYQNTTIGRLNRDEAQVGLYPNIGAGTTIYSGAVIVGGLTVGENCLIAANAVVLADVPPNHTAAGVPARVFPHKKANSAMDVAD